MRLLNLVTAARLVMPDRVLIDMQARWLRCLQVRFSYDYGRCWRTVPLQTAMYVENIR